jgi:hypothetical protein
MHLEESSNYPAVSIPNFSNVHNVFFEHMATYFVTLNIGFEVHYLVDDQMCRLSKVDSESFIGKEYDSPHDVLLAAISALQKIKKG